MMAGLRLAAMVALLALARAAGADSNAAADAPMTLYFYERPPFHYTGANGRPAGQFVETTERLLRRAGLRFEWVRMPANRILGTLRDGPAQACSPGWYNTPERRANFWLSKPLLRDKPLIALLRADFRVPPLVSAKVFLQMPGVRLLLKQNFSQGAYMDTLIARMPVDQVQRVTAEVPVMVGMLKVGRADTIITTESEAELFIRQAGLAIDEFQIVHFPDVPATEYRYLLCNRFIEPGIRTRIDGAIAMMNF